MSRYLHNTQRYYAEWVDACPDDLAGTGARAICSPKRDERQVGYPDAFRLYCVVTETAAVLSYAREFEATVPQLVETLSCRPGPEQFLAALKASLPGTPGHAVKFCFDSLPADLDTSRARQLSHHQFADYLHFREALYPGVSQEWLEDYFSSMADLGYAFGVYDGGRLVCATDAPSVPYMVGQVVEQGINTLPNCRQRGHAKAACGAMLAHLLATGKTPIWSTSAGNPASISLALAIGYRKFADVYTVTTK